MKREAFKEMVEKAIFAGNYLQSEDVVKLLRMQHNRFVRLVNAQRRVHLTHIRLLLAALRATGKGGTR